MVECLHFLFPLLRHFRHHINDIYVAALKLGGKQERTHLKCYNLSTNNVIAQIVTYLKTKVILSPSIIFGSTDH